LRAAESDLVLWVTDAENEQGEDVETSAATTWMVRNKIDLDPAGGEAGAGTTIQSGQGATFRISAGRGDGISELVAALGAFAQNYFGAGEDGLIGRERQRQLLRETTDGLRRCLAVAGQGDELAAEELRVASQALGRLLGRIDVEDILDKIFREFCIGK
jgi:tRNA modification GTPase